MVVEAGFDRFNYHYKPSKPMQPRPTPAHLLEFISRTGNLLIHLLDTCNLSCKHCYLNARRNGDQVLPLHIVKRTLDEASELGMHSVQFSGGEPFLYPYIHEVLTATLDKNFQVAVSTNGTCIDEASLGLLQDTKATMVTSIDGPAGYHDVFRGKKGSFAKTEAAIRRLVALGIPVQVVTTVSTDSLPYVDWFAQWAHNMGVPTLLFQPLESVGRGQRIGDKRLNTENLHDLFIQLNDLAAYYLPKGLQIKMTYKSRDFMLLHPCAAFVCNGKNCHRGVEKEVKKIVIRENGLILPELVDIDQQFAIGNLYDDTLTNNLLDFLEHRYTHFDRLCREVFKDTVIDYPSPLVPWDELLAERSRAFTPLF
jgi:MoaA/NifB/PqqE/SkfB family radical SAM enzyme